MKSELRTIEKLEFPKLMKSDKGLVILATAQTCVKHLTGTCVAVGDSPNKLGKYSDMWIATFFTDMDENIEVVLKN